MLNLIPNDVRLFYENLKSDLKAFDDCDGFGKTLDFDKDSDED